MTTAASLTFKLEKPDRGFYVRLVGAWVVVLLVAISYCLLHQFVAGTPYGTLETPATWAFGNWGSWPLLLPLCFYVVRILSRRMRLWQAVLACMPLAVIGASLFHYGFYSVFKDAGSFLSTVYYMAPIASTTYGLFVVLAFWWVGPVMLDPATQEATLSDTKQSYDAGVKHLHASKGRLQARLPLEEIHWIQAARNYVELIAGGETYIMRTSMKELEDQLSAASFIRIHRSYIVNPTAVCGVLRSAKGEPSLQMVSGADLPVGRAYRDTALSALRLAGDAA